LRKAGIVSGLAIAAAVAFVLAVVVTRGTAAVSDTTTTTSTSVTETTSTTDTTSTTSTTPTTTTSTTTTSTTPTNPTGCPSNKSAKTAPISEISPPARLQITGFQVLSGPINARTKSFTLKVRVGSTCSVKIKGASVYVTAVPYNQFDVPAEETTGDDGTTILVFHRAGNYPASDKQSQLTLFIRATKPGEDPLAGVSTRRLVAVAFG
jgi:hypothetical protein